MNTKHVTHYLALMTALALSGCEATRRADAELGKPSATTAPTKNVQTIDGIVLRYGKEQHRTSHGVLFSSAYTTECVRVQTPQGDLSFVNHIPDAYPPGYQPGDKVRIYVRGDETLKIEKR